MNIKLYICNEKDIYAICYIFDFDSNIKNKVNINLK